MIGLLLKMLIPIGVIYVGGRLIKRVITKAILGPEAAKNVRIFPGFGSPNGAAGKPGGGVDPSDGTQGKSKGPDVSLVMDPQCKLYVSRDSTYNRTVAGKDLQFCSKKCADEYQAAAQN